MFPRWFFLSALFGVALIALVSSSQPSPLNMHFGESLRKSFGVENNEQFCSLKDEIYRCFDSCLDLMIRSTLLTPPKDQVPDIGLMRCNAACAFQGNLQEFFKKTCPQPPSPDYNKYDIFKNNFNQYNAYNTRRYN